MCAALTTIGFVFLLAFGALTSWIHYPVWWNWHRGSADWSAVWTRARRIGWWRWFSPLAVGASCFLVLAIAGCPS
jgi:hypothetical protein